MKLPPVLKAFEKKLIFFLPSEVECLGWNA